MASSKTGSCSSVSRIPEPEAITDIEDTDDETSQKQTSIGIPDMDTSGASFGLKAFSSSQLSHLSDSGPQFEAVYHMPYHHFCVKIYKAAREPVRFLYEPIVLLESIAMHVDKASGQAYISLTIKMWDAELTKQVENWIKGQPGNQDVQEFYVEAMPFEEVQLVSKETNGSTAAYRLPEKPTPYRQLDQRLKFYLLCETKEAAAIVAESFQSDADFAVRDLRLECNSIGNPAVKSQPKRARLDFSSCSTEILSCLDFRINTTIPAATRTGDHSAQGIPSRVYFETDRFT